MKAVLQGGGAASSWVITPALPAGLNFGGANGRITGTPAVPRTIKDYKGIVDHIQVRPGDLEGLSTSLRILAQPGGRNERPRLVCSLKKAAGFRFPWQGAAYI